MTSRHLGTLLLALALASIHGPIASARALSNAEVATLRSSNGDPRMPEWRAARKLAEALGNEQNLDALPLLLALRNSSLMHSFVAGYQYVVGTKPPTPEVEALALKLARDPSFARDDESWDTRADFFELLGNKYRSRELFDLFYASVRRELTSRRGGYSGMLPAAQRSLGGSVITSGVKGIDEPIAALLPLLPDACQGDGYIAFLGDHHYLPATDRLIDLYRRTPVKSGQCAQRVAWTLASFHTPSATQAIAARIRWLLDHPQSDPRDDELVSAISTLGNQPVEAQVDLETLEADVMARVATPSLRPKLQALFRQQADYARRARTIDAESLAFFVSRNEPDVVRSLLDHHADPNGVDRQGATPLVVAACQGDLEIVRMLVEAGADVNRPSAWGALPLEMRCNAGDPAPGGVNDARAAEVAQFLLARGAHINAIDRMGLTALHVAAYAGNVKVMGVLLAHGARIDAPKLRAARSDGTLDPTDLYAGWAPIHFAAIHFSTSPSKLAAVELLLDRGANINARAEDGTTALLLAVAFRNEGLTKVLVERGADVNLSAKGGVTPIIMAHENGDRETEALLRSKGAAPNPLVVVKLAIIRAWVDQLARGMQ